MTRKNSRNLREWTKRKPNKSNSCLMNRANREIFTLESEMTPTVRKWLYSRGLIVKAEFGTSGGICDLVGVQFIQNSLKIRERFKQLLPVPSVLAAALLLHTPDVKSKRKISDDELAKKVAPHDHANDIYREIDRLLKKNFLIRTVCGDLQKKNGWLPLFKSIVSVELKIDRISEAFMQSWNNMSFSDESYVAFPEVVASRIYSNKEKWKKYFSAGIGLLAVSQEQINVLINSKCINKVSNIYHKIYYGDKFITLAFQGR